MEVHIAMTDYQFLETLMNNKKKNVEKTSNNKHDWTRKISECFASQQKTKAVVTLFS